VVATMSLFHEIHAWNRQHLPAYYEVFLEADTRVRMERDPKGMYARATAGRETHVGGLDLAVELPHDPHLTVVNNGGLREVPRIARCIVEAFFQWWSAQALAGETVRAARRKR
jgi:adenylylsulfate kinase-like enzyme